MYNPIDPFDNDTLPYGGSGKTDPEDDLKGCIASVAILLVFMALILIAELISTLY